MKKTLTQTTSELVALHAHLAGRHLQRQQDPLSPRVVGRYGPALLASMARHSLAARFLIAHRQRREIMYDPMRQKSHSNLTPMVEPREMPTAALRMDDLLNTLSSQTTKRMQHHGTVVTRMKRSRSKWNHAEDSSEDEEDQQSLVVTLRYGKGSTKPPNDAMTKMEDMPDAAPTNSANTNGSFTNGVAPAGAGAPRHSEQDIPAPMEPAIHPAPPQHPVAAFAHEESPAALYVPNGIPALQQQTPAAPVMPAAQLAQPVANPAVLPKLDGIFPAPQQQQPVQYLNGQPAQHQPPMLGQQQQQPLKPTLPSPTPATNWQ
jgi:hypothetical protein